MVKRGIKTPSRTASPLAASPKLEGPSTLGASPRVFISHAAVDKPLVDLLVELLESGMGVPTRQIFYASSSETGIGSGEDFDERIREELKGAAYAIAVVSEAYYASPFCMCELGGIWALARSLTPLLVPPIGHPHLKAVLAKRHALRITEPGDLDQLFEETKKRLSLEHPQSTPRWNTKKGAFLLGIQDALKGLPKMQTARNTVPSEPPVIEESVPPTKVQRSDADALALIGSWFRGSAQEGTHDYTMVDRAKDLELGTTKRLMPRVQIEFWTFQLYDTVFVADYSPRVRSSRVEAY